MAKLYFVGGENIVKRDAREINEKAFQDAGGKPNILVFPWARASFDRTYKCRKRVFDYFRSLGASSIEFAEYSDQTKDIAAKFESSDLIYLTGGQLTILVTRLRSMGVDSLLRGFAGVVVGRSAGALALCKWCIVTERYRSIAKIATGLGIVDFTIKVHYDSSKDAYLKELSKNHKIYAVPERAALVFHGDAISCLGKVFLFDNGEKLLCPP